MQGIFVTKPLNTDIISSLNALLFLIAIFFYNNAFTQKLSLDNSGQREINISFLLIVFFNCYYVLGESIFWVAAVYLWPLIIFILCSYFLKLIEEKNISQKEKILLLFLCFILGNSIELLFVPGLLIIARALKRSQDSRKFHGALVGAFLFGTVLLICSPGNYRHLTAAENDLSLNILNQLSNAKMVFSKTAYLLKWNLIVSVLIAIFIPAFQSITKKEAIKECLYFFALGLGSLLPLIPLHGFSADRTYIYFCIFMSYSLIWGVQYIKMHLVKFNLPQTFTRLVHSTVIILAIGLLVINIIDARKIKAAFLDQQQAILQQSAQSQTVSIQKLPLPMHDHILYYMDVSSDKEVWANRAQSKFHGVESITAF